jgi:AcrR family transcriptional regulator
MTIDHTQRRRFIAEVAIDLIAAEGLGAATIRRIATNARFSTAAITHYFADKQELTLWAFTQLSTYGVGRFEEAVAEAPADIIYPLLTMLAWCPQNVRRWKAYLAFWDSAARDAELATLIRQSTAAGLAQIEQLIARNAPDAPDIAKASRIISSYIQGMSLQLIVAQQQCAAEEVRRDLAEVVRLALQPPGHHRTGNA